MHKFIMSIDTFFLYSTELFLIPTAVGEVGTVGEAEAVGDVGATDEAVAARTGGGGEKSSLVTRTSVAGTGDDTAANRSG